MHALTFSELSTRTPENAVQYAGQIHTLLRALADDVNGEAKPQQFIVPDSQQAVILSDAGSTTTDPIEISWPRVGYILGVGCEVAEGAEHRARLSFELTVNGKNALVRKGKTGSAFLPITALAGASRGNTIHMPVYWRVTPEDEWAFRFKSESSPLDIGAPPITLTALPYFLFVEDEGGR